MAVVEVSTNSDMERVEWYCVEPTEFYRLLDDPSIHCELIHWVGDDDDSGINIEKVFVRWWQPIDNPVEFVRCSQCDRLYVKNPVHYCSNAVGG